MKDYIQYFYATQGSKKLKITYRVYKNNTISHTFVLFLSIDMYKVIKAQNRPVG